MKWLILSDEDCSDFINKMKKEFSKADFFIYSYESVSSFDFDFLSKITHAIFLNFQKESNDFSFILGFFSGSGVNIYSISDFNKKKFSNEKIKVFKNKNELFSSIVSLSESILKEEEKKNALEYLFKNGYPFDSENFSHFIKKWNKKICEYYVRAGMDVNVTDLDGTPLLNIASREDNLAAVKWLCSCGANLNLVSKDRGYTAIMDSVWRGNAEIVKFLIKKGSPLNTISKEGQTMLILAVGADRTEIVKMLSEGGADPDIKDGMGMSAYDYAKLFKKSEILSILEKYHKEQ